ncbi:MAG: DNA polymerase III subunit gamma/tau [Defluviitaleaceae bacterium]|nr:DNA polymerase III subunit gamma/tau [Defluviitaleaceae bacterium]
MSYTALYRKIRPRTFKNIVGQPHIVRALVNQLVSGQVSHAYLFCGTRGTGKTSAAKILARAINCPEQQDGEPCNECEMCKSILAERCLDVAEIDAASNNGVENIRDLRDEVKYLPNEGQFKVYIVDEVHMLSGAAFNALLKTLEEPPSHVIFILATTDPQKIPATILSRCQRYDFRRISAVDMVAALRGHLEGEDVDFEEAALDYIAYHSDGAMRDAVSLLDQCISFGEGEGLSLAKVREVLGAVDRAQLFEFTDALATADTAAIIGIIASAMDAGRDVSQFANDLVRHFRDVLVAGLTDGEAKLKEQAGRVSKENLMRYIAAFSETIREMKFVPHMRTAFEVCALKICMPVETQQARHVEMPASPVSVPLGAVNSKTSTTVVETPARPVSAPPGEVLSKTSTPASGYVNSRERTSLAIAGKGELIRPSWKRFCLKLPIPIRSICVRCEVEEVNGMLKIYCGDETSQKLIEGKQAIIREQLADFFNLTTPPNLAIEVREAYNKPIEKTEEPPLPGTHGRAAPGNGSDQPEPPPQEEDDWATMEQVQEMSPGDEEW